VLEENIVKKNMNGGDFESCRFNTKQNSENESAKTIRNRFELDGGHLEYAFV